MLIMKTVSFEELSNGMSIQEVVSLKNERLCACLDGLREHDPVLYAEVADSDLFTSDPAVLKSLLARCKDEVVCAWLLGILTFRLEMSVVTGRSY